jgi:hypothetical protein
MQRVSLFDTAAVWALATALAWGQFIPGGIEEAGVLRLVDDTVAFMHDPDQDDVLNAQLGNWEPYASVLGNSVFLIESNIYAEGDDPFALDQQFGLLFQPVAGGPPGRGYVFHDDDGAAFKARINATRQNGNPGRVAGDKRPGATALIAGGEANPHAYPEFQSDARWETGVVRDLGDGTPGRYAAVQTHALDPATLCQTPTGKAFDAVLGRLTGGDATVGAGGTEIGRFGGELAGLSDGNFLVVVDDKSNLHNTERSATAVIVSPSGAIVKDTFLIGPGQIWSNACAFKGGFCVRLNGKLRFYSNAGDFQGEVDQDDARLVDGDQNVLFAFDRGRGDGTRIQSHINSDYVFLAGRNNEAVKDVRLAVWDARDRSYKGSINVNELAAVDGGTDAETFRPGLDRVNLAVDALNRIAVTYEVLPDGYSAQQVALRVLAFDAAGPGFSYLTPSFFPFINHLDLCGGVGLPIRGQRPSPAMTTKEILIAAKGELNTGNIPDDCADVPGETNFYTVISHPDPQDDPTPPITPAFEPGGIETAGLTRVVADTIAFEHDPEDDDVPNAQLGNWEPYTSVLGNSTFLVESNIYATGEDPFAQNQQYGVVFQPAAGGEPVRGAAFHADDGTPFTGKINETRQNGNPGRVAGDKRPGATALIAGGEANPHAYPEFQSDARWDTGVIRNTGDGTPGRYAAVQTHCFDAARSTQRPLGKAFDAVLGRLTEGDATAGAGGTQIGRFGGELAGLSDGNFLVVVDDRSNLHNTERSATAVIVSPAGAIVKDTFVVGPGEIWSNACAFKGGFCVRLNGKLRFYSNAGDFQGEVDQDDAKLTDCNGAATFAFDRGRGDGTRIQSHINSNHVFLAGRNNEAVKDVRVAVWDARDRSYKGSANVNELPAGLGGKDATIFRPAFDRVNLAVDALNRLVVTYEVQPAGYAAQQVAARVLAFDEGAASFSYLTPSFFPFTNHSAACEGAGLPIRSFRPSPSMTTRQILIAAKGEPHSLNLEDECSDFPGETNYYTVISHPDPKDDPTPPVAATCGEVCDNDLDDDGDQAVDCDDPDCASAPTCLGGLFHRGDSNNDGLHNISDPVNTLNVLFLGTGSISCQDAADSNDDGVVNISDPVNSLNVLFLGTGTVPPPLPPEAGEPCGQDPTAEGLDLGCTTYSQC